LGSSLTHCLAHRVSSGHAPSASRQRAERCDGGAGAYSAAKGGGFPPQRAAFRHPRLGVLLARCKLVPPAGGQALSSIPSCRAGWPCASRRSPPRRHCCRSDGNGRSGPPGYRAIPLSFQAPAVCTWTKNGPIHVPSQQTTPTW
jgi:hypothetical protein